jgi:dienelactone hydrolase
MRLTKHLSVNLLFAFLLASSTVRAAEKTPPPALTRTTFAELLKIPVEHPKASVTVRNSKQEDDLIIEDIVWESLDGEHPIAYVVRPAKAQGRLPAVICLHGTSGSRDVLIAKQFGVGDWTSRGGAAPQPMLLGWARELARRGYLALALTQRGLDLRQPDTDEQSKVLLVQGRTLMGAIVYEIRQAITYLQARGDVDPARIGVTGFSFGGITTFYTWLVDDRIAAAAPICGGIGSVRIFSDRGARTYHGIYWWLPGMLQKGDQADFAASLAPRPLMVWAPLEDIGMPKEGVDEFLRVAQPAYVRAGGGQNLVVHRPHGKHQFSLEAFDAMERFFCQHLKGCGQ